MHEGAQYLTGHFRSRATLELTLYQARVLTRVSRVGTLGCFLETPVKLRYERKIFPSFKT